MSYSQVRTVSATLSYLYAVQTGQQGTNWPEVTAVLQTYDESDFKLVRKSLKPTVIPSPPSLKTAPAALLVNSSPLTRVF